MGWPPASPHPRRVVYIAGRAHRSVAQRSLSIVWLRDYTRFSSACLLGVTYLTHVACQSTSSVTVWLTSMLACTAASPKADPRRGSVAD
eukprot:6388052-Pyramimonas_sp.AAC.1